MDGKASTLKTNVSQTFFYNVKYCRNHFGNFYAILLHSIEVLETPEDGIIGIGGFTM